MERKGKKMKKTSRLPAALLVLCLLLSLFSLPAPAESIYREEFAATGGWPPELIGSWVGYYMSTWGCWSFYPDGRHIMTNFDFAGFNMTGTSKTLKPAEELTFETTAEGDMLHLKAGGNTGEFRKVSMPWVRLKAEKETAASGVDPAILGTFATFGTTLGGLYTEWTFHGDGRFTQVTPYKELTEHGTYLAGDGNLVILLNGKIISCSYKAEKSLQLHGLPDVDRLFMRPKTGPLVQVPGQWDLDATLENNEQRKKAYQEQFGKTGGWPPELIGSWVGSLMGTWLSWSFYPDGQHVLTNFNESPLNAIGTSKTLESVGESSFEKTTEGEFWHFRTEDGYKGEFRKVCMPWVRLKAEKETAAAGLDPAILGTFGSILDGLYTEWTFHGDGRLTQVTPYEESRIEGTYITGDGHLAIFLNGEIISCPYKAGAGSLSLTYPDAFKVLQRKTGPLVQVPDQWNID